MFLKPKPHTKVWGMTKKRIIPQTLVWGAVIFLSSAVWAEPLSLKQAVTTAFKNNPELAAARAQWEAAKAKVNQAVSLADPKLGLEYDQIPSGSRKPEDGLKMYTAEQMIDFPGKTYAEWQMAARTADLFRARFIAKQLEISSQTKAAYYDLYLADRSIETTEDVRLILSRAKRTAESKYITGKVSQADVLEADIELRLVENDLTNLRQERAVEAARLESLIVSTVAPIETEKDIASNITVGSLEVWERVALANRPALQAMKAELEMSDSAQLRSKMDFFPDLDLGARKRLGDGWDAMLSFSVPLYFWKQGYGLSAAGFEREAAESNLRNMQNMTHWEIREAYVMAASAKRTIALYETTILPQSQQAHTISLAAYQTGKLDFSSLLQIIKMHQAANLKYYGSRVDLGKALARLEELTGGELK